MRSNLPLTTQIVVHNKSSRDWYKLVPIFEPTTNFLADHFSDIEPIPPLTAEWDLIPLSPQRCLRGHRGHSDLIQRPTILSTDSSTRMITATYGNTKASLRSNFESNPIKQSMKGNHYVTFGLLNIFKEELKFRSDAQPTVIEIELS